MHSTARLVALGFVALALLVALVAAAIWLGQGVDLPREQAPHDDGEHGEAEADRDGADDEPVRGADDTLP